MDTIVAKQAQYTSRHEKSCQEKQKRGTNNINYNVLDVGNDMFILWCLSRQGRRLPVCLPEGAAENPTTVKESGGNMAESIQDRLSMREF